MAIDNPADGMMTVNEVSRLLHIHPNTLRHWADKGVIKSFRITSHGGRRFTAEDINQFLAEMSNQNR
jgi:excisionase family DNA binding protein